MTAAEVQNRRTDQTLTNSVAEIGRRIPSRRVTWTGPLLLVSLRTVLLLLFQVLTAAVLSLRHVPHAWIAAGKWWTVYGNLVDLCCIFLMWQFIRHEGIGFRDLIGHFRLCWGRDILMGLCLFALGFTILGIGLQLSCRLVYGTMFPPVLEVPPLPFWAARYTLFVWWILWSATEQVTYQAYALPRLEALTRRPWAAVLIVAFWWALQHCAVPFVDWRYSIVMVLGTFPALLTFVFIYRRIRRMQPLIIAQWPMDLYVAIMWVAPEVLLRVLKH